jgi:RNase H-fold protein (predicted Holliday junction resolvase)
LTSGFSHTQRGTVLAFDLGLKRTGVASGELGIGVAHPLSVIHGDSTQSRLDAIEQLHEGFSAMGPDEAVGIFALGQEQEADFLAVLQ